MPSRKTLTVRYPQKNVLLENFSRRGSRGTLFIETARRFELAEPISVVLEFPTEKRSFRVQGKVVSRRRGSHDPVFPPGVEVEFPTEENHTLQLALDHSEGKIVDFVERRSRRMACSFVVSYGRDSAFVRDFAEDIGEGGTFIRTNKLFPVGTTVECKLKPPGYLLGVRLAGRVAWVKTIGEPRGMGVEFLFENDRQRKKVRAIILKLVRFHARQLEKKMRELRESNRFR